MVNSTASIIIKPTVDFNHGDTFVFSSWVYTANGAVSFRRYLTMIPNPETGLMTLAEVVTGQLVEKFDEFSLYNQAADFEIGSASNSNLTSPWIEPHEMTPKPLCGTILPHERFPYSLRNTTAGYVDTLVPCQSGKEIVSKYSLDSNVVPSYNSNSSYEIDFGSNPIESEFELNTTEESLLGPAAGLAITTTTTDRFVYWPDHKPADLTDDNSRCVTYLETLPF
jgi:hypothetical protein